MSTDSSFVRTDLLPPTVPGAVVALLAVGGLLLWLAVRRLTARHRADLPRWGVVVPRVVTAATAAWCGLQLLGRCVELGSRWPLWLAGLVAGLAVELTVALYGRERRVIDRRLGYALVALRCTAIVMLILILLQPVLKRTVGRRIVRRVAVLMDDSDSMHFTDRQWTLSEKVGLGVQSGLCGADERQVPALERVPAWHARLSEQMRAAPPTNQAPTTLVRTLREGTALVRELQTQVDRLVAGLDAGAAREQLEPLGRLQRQARDATLPALAELVQASQARQLAPRHLERLGEAVDQLNACLAPAREAADTLAWERLPAPRREAIDALCQTSRWVLAESILTRRGAADEALLDRLAERYDIELYRLGRSLQRLPAEQVGVLALDRAGQTNGAVERVRRDWRGLLASNSAPVGVAAAFRSGTDYAAALETVAREIPSEQLAGVLLLSDGRHNGDTAVDPIARRLGLQDVPVSTILVGGSRLPFDASLADVSVPESIYLGDQVRARAVVRATGAMGRKLAVRLMLGGETVDQTELAVSSADWQQEVRLAHAPTTNTFGQAAEASAGRAGSSGGDAGGVGALGYTLRIDPVPEELFADNNDWNFDVAVSDDRTNVLLVDDRPRWEFRYLRNLFFGRDKSIHLQYVLLHPDTIDQVAVAESLPPASAGRAFGDAEAGALPRDRDEWRKFDVIILGDVGPDVLTPEVVAEVQACVAERGALLVVIAGPQAMPHAFADARLGELLPVRYEAATGGCWIPPEDAFRVVLTPAGRAHPILQQSTSVTESEAIWAGLPEMRWRFPLADAKPGAEVLAYAVASDEAAEDFSGVTVADAVAKLEAETRKRNRDALIVAQNYGRGKVLMLNFDRTWRLRYRVGDTYHHRFWGQVVRWGVGEKLRAGHAGLRLGTDKLTYTPGEAVRVFGRVADPGFQPVNDARLLAVLLRNGAELVRVPLAHREGSHGLYEGGFPELTEPGRYTVELRREDGGKSEPVRTILLVVTARRPVERSDVAASRETPDLMARWTAGRVVAPEQADTLWNSFGAGRRTLSETVEQPLWNSPFWFVALVGLLTVEWLLRKRGGLT